MTKKQLGHIASTFNRLIKGHIAKNRHRSAFDIYITALALCDDFRDFDINFDEDYFLAFLLADIQEGEEHWRGLKE